MFTQNARDFFTFSYIYCTIFHRIFYRFTPYFENYTTFDNVLHSYKRVNTPRKRPLVSKYTAFWDMLHPYKCVPSSILTRIAMSRPFYQQTHSFWRADKHPKRAGKPAQERPRSRPHTDNPLLYHISTFLYHILILPYLKIFSYTHIILTLIRAWPC